MPKLNNIWASLHAHGMSAAVPNQPSSGPIVPNRCGGQMTSCPGSRAWTTRRYPSPGATDTSRPTSPPVEWRPSPSRKSPHSTTTSLAFALSPVAPAPEPGRRFTRRRRRRSGRLRAAAPSTEECLLLLPPSSTTAVGDHPHSPPLRLPFPVYTV